MNFAAGNRVTALHYAALNGHANLVKLLLKNGANVNAVDRNNMTPLHYARGKI